MSANLNTPQIIAGKLCECDLMPAEACTELGADDISDRGNAWMVAAFIIGSALLGFVAGVLSTLFF